MECFFLNNLGENDHVIMGTALYVIYSQQGMSLGDNQHIIHLRAGENDPS